MKLSKIFKQQVFQHLVDTYTNDRHMQTVLGISNEEYDLMSMQTAREAYLQLPAIARWHMTGNETPRDIADLCSYLSF